MIDMRELDHCGAIGAALIKANAKKPDPRYQEGIDLAATHILTRQLRLADGTLARPRPVKVALWIDDAYMSIPFLAQMGKATGETKYFDDAARQVIGMSARLFDRDERALRPLVVRRHGRRRAVLLGPRRRLDADGDGGAAERDARPTIPIARRCSRCSAAARAARSKPRAARASGTSCSTRPTATSRPRPARCSPSPSRAASTAAGCPTSYAPVAQTGWRALEQRVRPDGQIEGICVGTTAAYDAVYYYNRPTELRAMQGYGPALMAGAEVITMLRSFDIRRRNNTFYYDAEAAVTGAGRP